MPHKQPRRINNNKKKKKAPAPGAAVAAAAAAAPSSNRDVASSPSSTLNFPWWDDIRPCSHGSPRPPGGLVSNYDAAIQKALIIVEQCLLDPASVGAAGTLLGLRLRKECPGIHKNETFLKILKGWGACMFLEIKEFPREWGMLWHKHFSCWRLRSL